MGAIGTIGNYIDITSSASTLTLSEPSGIGGAIVDPI